MTTLPNKENAFVEELKITGYLLNSEHEIGAAKADFFTLFGFRKENPDEFSKAIRGHANNRNVSAQNDTGYGVKFELQCSIETPDERNPCVVTVWIIDNGKEEPRLITAYPAKKGK